MKLDRVLGFAVAVSVGLWLAPHPVKAQDITVYEVSETMRVQGAKMARRVATASLVGTVQAGTELCPAAYASSGKCSINIVASDNVDLTTGKGPVHGQFAVVTQDNNATDSPEFVLFTGSLVGSIDLSPAVLSGVPLGSISGAFTVKGHPRVGSLERYGTFTGTFRLPFSVNGVPFYLVGPGPSDIVPVAETERALGWPTVRLELNTQ